MFFPLFYFFLQVREYAENENAGQNRSEQKKTGHEVSYKMSIMIYKVKSGELLPAIHNQINISR